MMKMLSYGFKHVKSITMNPNIINPFFKNNNGFRNKNLKKNYTY